jgi:hypothetical protein
VPVSAMAKVSVGGVRRKEERWLLNSFVTV